MNAALEHIETVQSLSVLSVLKTRQQNSLELLPVLLVQQEQFLMTTGHSVVMFCFRVIFTFDHKQVKI